MRKITVGARVSMDGVMQAPRGPAEDLDKGFKGGGGKTLFADGSAPRAHKLTRSRVSSSGVFIGHYEREGEIKIGDPALN